MKIFIFYSNKASLSNLLIIGINLPYPWWLDYWDSTRHFLLTSISKPDLMLSIVLNVMRTKVGKCHKLQFCFSDRLFFYFINFLQRHVITAKLVTAVTSSCLIQRLKANGYRNPDHSRALSKLCYGLKMQQTILFNI